MTHAPPHEPLSPAPPAVHLADTPRSVPVQVTELDGSSWDRLLEAFPARTVFHGGPWLRAIARRHGLQPVLLAVGDPAAPSLLWPWLVQRKGPLKVAGSPLPGWGTAYLGPLVAPGVDATALVAAALAHPSLRRASYLEARVMVRDQAVDLERHGFEDLRRFSTYVLDLKRDEAALWANLTNKCRNTVRKGQRNGYEIRREVGEDWIAPFFEMAEEVFANWGITPPYDPPLLEAIASELGACGQLWIYSAWREGRRDAVSVFFRDDRRLYYWAAASFDAAKNLGPNNVLVWEVIKAAREAGLEELDFISSSGSAGRFKKNFGPQEIEVARHYGRSRTALEGALKRGYERFVRWRRRV